MKTPLRGIIPPMVTPLQNRDALDCVGEELSDWLELMPVDPLYRAYYPDGSTLDVKSDPSAMAEEIRTVASPGARAVRLGGATVIPGLIDAHCHVSDVGYLAAGADCSQPFEAFKPI